MKKYLLLMILLLLPVAYAVDDTMSIHGQLKQGGSYLQGTYTFKMVFSYNSTGADGINNQTISVNTDDQGKYNITLLNISRADVSRNVYIMRTVIETGQVDILKITPVPNSEWSRNTNVSTYLGNFSAQQVMNIIQGVNGSSNFSLLLNRSDEQAFNISLLSDNITRLNTAVQQNVSVINNNLSNLASQIRYNNLTLQNLNLSVEVDRLLITNLLSNVTNLNISVERNSLLLVGTFLNITNLNISVTQNSNQIKDIYLNITNLNTSIEMNTLLISNALINITSLNISITQLSGAINGNFTELRYNITLLNNLSIYLTQNISLLSDNITTLYTAINQNISRIDTNLTIISIDLNNLNITVERVINGTNIQVNNMSGVNRIRWFDGSYIWNYLTGWIRTDEQWLFEKNITILDTTNTRLLNASEISGNVGAGNISTPYWINQSGNTPLTGNWNAQKNITGDWFFGTFSGLFKFITSNNFYWNNTYLELNESKQNVTSNILINKQIIDVNGSINSLNNTIYQQINVTNHSLEDNRNFTKSVNDTLQNRTLEMTTNISNFNLGNITGSGTTNKIPIWINDTHMGNSVISQVGTDVKISTSSIMISGGSARIDLNSTAGTFPSYRFFINDVQQWLLGMNSLGDFDWTYVPTSKSVLYLDNDSRVGIGTDTPTALLHVVQNGTGNYFLKLGDSAAAVNRFVVNETGSVGIGTGTPIQSLTIRNVGSDAGISFNVNDVTGWHIGIDESSATDDFAIGAGQILGASDWIKIVSTTGRLFAQGVYDISGAASANVYVAADGNLYRATSSEKYKKNIRNMSLEESASKILEVTPILYDDNSTYAQDHGSKTFIGLSAEELDKQGFNYLVSYDLNGTPESVMYDRISLYLLNVIKEQNKEIANLKSIVCKTNQNEEFCKS